MYLGSHTPSMQCSRGDFKMSMEMDVDINCGETNSVTFWGHVCLFYDQQQDTIMK